MRLLLATAILLLAQDRASVTGGRLRRQVSTRIGGRWVDAGRAMVAEGHALWLPNGTEWAWNGQYADLSRQAAAIGLRLWDPQGCGPGPASDARISLRLNFDAEHNDRLNVDGEWVEISNGSAEPLALAGWWFRDSALRRYTFPAAAVVPAGGRVTLRMGSGADAADTFHWRLPTPPFENPTYDERAVGDGGYLFDPRGNLRAWSIYN